MVEQVEIEWEKERESTFQIIRMKQSAIKTIRRKIM